MVALINSQIIRKIILLITISSISLPAYAKYSGGTGEPNDPYLIYTPEQMNTIGAEPNDWDKHFKLMEDIDMSDYTGASLNMIGYTEGFSYGYKSRPFTGVFDGDGHIISNLICEFKGRDYAGLFGYVGVDAEVKNIGIIDPNMRLWPHNYWPSTTTAFGSLVGCLHSASLTNCYVEGGTVSSESSVGGLVGWNYYGTVDNCYSSCSILGRFGVGGLVGSNVCGEIVDCYSFASVYGIGKDIGGLVGDNSYGSIRSSYSDSVVKGRDNVGGLAGSGAGVYDCFSSGKTIGINNVGGLIGYTELGSVVNCYASSTVLGDRYVGGLIGRNSATIKYCYSIGDVNAIDDVNGVEDVGGLVGNNDDAEVIGSFWDMETSGWTTSAAGLGKTTTEMYDPNTFIDVGWDFVGQSDGLGDIWAIPLEGGYPVLWWEIPRELGLPSFSGGSGEVNDPYLITTAEELNSIAHNARLMKSHFRLIDDINLAGLEFHPIGELEHPYAGIFDGAGFEISNFVLTSTGETYNGLFRCIRGRGAQIRNLGLVNPMLINIGGRGGSLVGWLWQGNLNNCHVKDGSVSGHGSLGGLVGSNGGTLTACYSTSNVRGESPYGSCGGLVASNGGTITCSYSTGIVEGAEVGGLAGQNSGDLLNCYSTCNVSGQRVVGGLVGWNIENAKIMNCYSTGKVIGDKDTGGLVGLYAMGFSIFYSSITGSFWDTQTSSQWQSDGGIGKTTAKMQTASTYLEAGWDFVDETANGTDDIWKMWDGYDYPRSSWEPGPNTPLVFVDINDPGFYGQMSKYEVTNAQYCDFLNAALASGDITVNDADVYGAGGSNGGEDYIGQRYYRCDGSGYTGYGATNGGAARIHYSEGAFSVNEGFGNHPVTYVSWYGAMAFCNYYGYYLPAEDQWQAVADYDGTYIYGCGETIDPGIANYRNSEHPDGTTLVGSFGVYGYGMSDMAGNVWEWTSSSLDSNRIFRGGSLGSYDSDCNVSIRGDGIPYANYYDIGFRVCR